MEIFFLLKPLHVYRLSNVIFYTTYLFVDAGKTTEKKGGENEGCVAAFGDIWHAYNEEAGISHTSCLAMADCLGSSVSQASNGSLVVHRWYVTSKKQVCDLPSI